MSDWWNEVEAALQAESEHAPDPWAAFDEAPADGELTEAQKAFLQQLHDLPTVHRLTDD